MKTDSILLQEVKQALKFERSVADSDIVVISDKGIVTLTGSVDNYTKKIKAENISAKIVGVKSVINKISVTINSWDEKKDIEITAEILKAFRWNWNTLNDTIKVKVINGYATLSGEVEWNYQKEAAKEAVINLIGVKGVTNGITIKFQSETTINKGNLKQALQNHLALDSIDIDIEVSESNITLKGSVETWYQKELAGRIAWKAPGVVNVDNELVIQEE